MTNVLQNLSSDLASVVEAASPAIVRVEGRRRLPASGVVLSADGLIATAHHVVQRESGLAVGLADGDSLEAELLGRDPTTDLALLKVPAKDLPPAAWADSDGLQVGHLVLAAGRPRRSVQATLGIVSALGDAWRSHAGGQIDRYLQTDVVMYPGFSGGALLGAGGAVHGIVTSALFRGVSLTIPTETVKRVADDLQAHGRVRRGFLGVSAQPVELPRAAAESVGRAYGLLLMTVEADSPAEAGGLALGDTIVAFGGDPIESLDDLLGNLTGDRIGQTIELSVLRGGELISRQVTIGDRAEN
jgi:S1-C subfamily serine protease